jgi:hypothetical protein
VVEKVFQLELQLWLMLVSNGHRLPLIGTQWECGPWNWRILFSFTIAMACHLSDYARIMPTLPTWAYQVRDIFQTTSSTIVDLMLTARTSIY